MQRVMQDRGVGVAVEGDVGAQAGLQAEIAEGGGASDEGIEEAVAITLQLDAAGLQIVDRNFVAQPRCQQRLDRKIGVVGKSVAVREDSGGGRLSKKKKN